MTNSENTAIQQNNNLMDQIHQLRHLMRRYQGNKMHQGSPHRGQGRVLALLSIQPEISQKELSYLLDMRQQSISELLLKLEQKSYITRTPSEEDRRTTIIRLTEDGKAASQQPKESQKGFNKVLDVLTSQEQQTLSGYLERITQALKDELIQSGFTPEDLEAIDPADARRMMFAMDGCMGKGHHHHGHYHGQEGCSGGHHGRKGCKKGHDHHRGRGEGRKHHHGQGHHHGEDNLSSPSGEED